MQTLVDTSVWIDHLRKRSVLLSALLEAEQVCTHHFIIGELACGNLVKRSQFLTALNLLPHIGMTEHDDVMLFAEAHKLSGRGLGWIDMHLLASASLYKQQFWTRDKRLAAAALDLGISAQQ
jgi:predicted nucleic acid-binding protein